MPKLFKENGNFSLVPSAPIYIHAPSIYVVLSRAYIGSITPFYYCYFSFDRRYVVDKRKEKGSVCLHKEWANFPEPFAYQTTVRDITAFAPEFKEKVTTLSELFQPKTHCFILSNPHYGSLAEVT